MRLTPETGSRAPLCLAADGNYRSLLLGCEVSFSERMSLWWRNHIGEVRSENICFLNTPERDLRSRAETETGPSQMKCWCWRGELNPHAVCTARDFESRASANSATPAYEKKTTPILPLLACRQMQSKR